MRLAAIDIGSDSIHLLVVDADAIGNQRVLARESSLVQLDKGLARSGQMDPETFQAGLETLALMSEIVRGFQCDTVMAYGTAVLREAANAHRFIAESARLGIHIRVISAEEEARLIYVAVKRAGPFPEEPAVLLDMDGSCTTMTWVAGERVPACLSLPWGPQRLADVLPTADPSTPEDLKRVRKSIRRILKKARRQRHDSPQAPVILGTSGTLLDLAQHASGENVFTRDQLLQFKRKLWRASRQERVEQLKVDPGCSGTSHISASWLLGIMDWLGSSHVTCLPAGLREGMIWDALQHGGRAAPAPQERRGASVEALAAGLDPDPVHSLHVGRLADQLFLDLRPALGLGDSERELLGHAARLHDIGLSVSGKEHHKQGAYLIHNAALTGFRRKEAELVAQIVRFHRGKEPDPERHEGYGQLAPWHRTTVEKLSAILRVADALDRSRRQAVSSVRLSLEAAEAQLHIEGSGNLNQEFESLQEKGTLLFRLLDRPVRTLATTPS